MRITILQKSENSVSALVRRHYPNLSESQLQKAEAELLKANPHLADVSAFKPGTVVNLPDKPELKLKTGQAGDDPVEEMLGQLKDSVADYGKIQTRRLNDELTDLAAQEALLTDKEVVAAIKNSPEASKTAATLAASLRNRAAQNKVDKKDRDVLFARIGGDIDALFK